ncbi:hypothetical protein QWJ34_00075 [Saccharibacillus sp. CPCC 101409]|uniref:hypothetical protein n=1 Tax=Saccharibacillus sp. CPCC 101409 TaxID=3058041 RepID=UPI0026727E70|nr:hypothetical protein [Saccharibacillus sp. CPCC 101409]MDO3408152.1 hypothetical protein [Saccharibacillus sp. CPCC 101409]
MKTERKREARLTAGSLERIKTDVYRRAELPAPAGRSRTRAGRLARMTGRRAGAAASAVLVLGIATGAANAAGLIDLNAALGFIGGERVGILKPINRSSEDQGIMMSVLGAVRDGDTAEVYVTMKDLEGDRIDDKMDVYDYFLQGGTSYNAELIRYDSQQQEATLRFLASGAKMNSRMTMNITSFLRGTHEESGYDAQLDLQKLAASQPEQSDRTLSRLKDGIGVASSGETSKELDKLDEFHVLPPGDLSVELPGLDWLQLSNIGFVDGKLHIQFNPDNDMGRYNRADFYLTDGEGNRRNIEYYRLSWGEYEKDGVVYGGDYEEYVFDISDHSQLKGLRLMGSLLTYQEMVRGHWETTFDLKQESRMLKGAADVKLDSAQITGAEVSPLGVTLTGTGFDRAIEEDEDILGRMRLAVHFKDGTKLAAAGGFIRSENGPIKWLAPETLAVEDVDYVSLNGEKIVLSES